MFRRQVRQRQNLYSVFSQLALFICCTGAVNILLVCLAVVDFARLISKFITDIGKFSLNFLVQCADRHSQGRRPFTGSRAYRGLRLLFWD